MKKSNWKNIVIIVLCSAVTVVSTLFVLWGWSFDRIYEDIHLWNNRDYDVGDVVSEATEAASEAVDEAAVDDGNFYEADQVADAVRACNYIMYYGDTGYLMKGALLDATAKTNYDKLPDTLAVIHYGEKLEQAKQRYVDFDSKDARFKLLKNSANNQALTAYQKLAELGKAEGLKLMPDRRNKFAVIGECDFDDQYGNYFNPENSAQRNTPLPIKKILVDYFKSDEGKDYQFVQDRRKTEQVYRLDHFTGIDSHTQKPTKSLVTILTHKNGDGSFRERILIVGYNENTQEGKILFNEAFYGNKLLINVYDSPANLPDEAWSLAKYMTPSKKLIEVKMDNGSNIYLYYDDDFDTMNRKTFSESDREPDEY